MPSNQRTSTIIAFLVYMPIVILPIYSCFNDKEGQIIEQLPEYYLGHWIQLPDEMLYPPYKPDQMLINNRVVLVQWYNEDGRSETSYHIKEIRQLNDEEVVLVTRSSSLDMKVTLRYDEKGLHAYKSLIPRHYDNSGWEDAAPERIGRFIRRESFQFE